MRALVMGGTEFISLHLVRELLASGHEVTVYNRGTRSERLPVGVTSIAGDRKDHAGLRQRLANHVMGGLSRGHTRPSLPAPPTIPSCR